MSRVALSEIVAERVWYRSTPKHRLIDVKSVLFSGINNDRRASEAGILVGCISKCIVTCSTHTVYLFPLAIWPADNEQSISRLRFDVLSIDYVRVTSRFYDYDYDYDFATILLTLNCALVVASTSRTGIPVYSIKDVAHVSILITRFL